MFNSINKILYICLLIFIISCAGSSTGEKPGDYTYIANIGLVSDYDYADKTRLSLNKYQFQIEREENYGNRKYLETMWKYRNPYEDEAALSIAEVKTRLVLHSTPRTRRESSTRLYKVQFVGEIMVRFRGIDEWKQIPMTEMCKKFFKNWALELKNDYSSGMRRY